MNAVPAARSPFSANLESGAIGVIDKADGLLELLHGEHRRSRNVAVDKRGAEPSTPSSQKGSLSEQCDLPPASESHTPGQAHVERASPDVARETHGGRPLPYRR
jgi:hypothetical protein